MYIVRTAFNIYECLCLDLYIHECVCVWVHACVCDFRPEGFQVAVFPSVVHVQHTSCILAAVIDCTCIPSMTYVDMPIIQYYCRKISYLTHAPSSSPILSLLENRTMMPTACLKIQKLSPLWQWHGTHLAPQV